MAEDISDLQTWLSEARAALRKVALGQQADDVSIEGKRVSYTPADANTLRAYIADLQARIIKAGGTCADGGARRVVRTVRVGW